MRMMMMMVEVVCLFLSGQMWLELLPVLRLERKLCLLQFRTALSERVRHLSCIATTWKGG